MYPNPTDISKARKIKKLNTDQLAKIDCILTVLSFTSNESRSRIFGLHVDSVGKLFTGEIKFDGVRLVELSKKIRLRPSTLIGRRNFDAAETKVEKGHKWKGPHDCFLVGNERLGKVLSILVEECELRPLLDKHDITLEEWSLIVAGKKPVTIKFMLSVENTLRDWTQGSKDWTDRYGPEVRRAYKAFQKKLKRIPRNVKTADRVKLTSSATVRSVSPEKWKEIEKRLLGQQ